MKHVIGWFSCSLLLAACGGGAAGSPAPETPEAPPAAEPTPQDSAPAEVDESAAGDKPAEATGPIEVTIESRSGSTLTGTATFEETSDGVQVMIRVGNTNAGLKATHIHEKGDCSDPEAKSAGDHFNPDGHNHGIPPDEKRHLGDLGNLGINPAGTGQLTIMVAGANLKPGDPHSFLDRAIIIHEKKDTGGQPSGNAGKRIGCGVIKRS